MITDSPRSWTYRMFESKVRAMSDEVLAREQAHVGTRYGLVLFFATLMGFSLISASMMLGSFPLIVTAASITFLAGFAVTVGFGAWEQWLSFEADHRKGL